jgi:hypothetical protein
MFFDFLALRILWLLKGAKGKPDDYTNNKTSLLIINAILIMAVLLMLYYRQQKKDAERLSRDRNKYKIEWEFK